MVGTGLHNACITWRCIPFLLPLFRTVYIQWLHSASKVQGYELASDVRKWHLYFHPVFFFNPNLTTQLNSHQLEISIHPTLSKEKRKYISNCTLDCSRSITISNHFSEKFPIQFQLHLGLFLRFITIISPLRNYVLSLYVFQSSFEKKNVFHFVSSKRFVNWQTRQFVTNYCTINFSIELICQRLHPRRRETRR